MLWNPALSVGIDAIDNQHQRIIEYINELEFALRDRDRDAVGEVIKQMVDYTVTHFAFEETLMERAGYKLIKEHHNVHESFTRLIRDYQSRFDAGEDVTRQLIATLRSWLMNHIKRDDQDYSAVVRAVLEESWLNKTLRKFFG